MGRSEIIKFSPANSLRACFAYQARPDNRFFVHYKKSQKHSARVSRLRSSVALTCSDENTKKSRKIVKSREKLISNAKMLFEPKDYVHRVNGVPLYYNGLTTTLYPSAHFEYQPQSPSPPYTSYDVLMSKLPARTSPLMLTPPISPLPEQQSRRDSVIMKVENCQVIPAAGGNSEQHVCRWENCYR